jgi:hypothetical protein
LGRRFSFYLLVSSERFVGGTPAVVTMNTSNTIVINVPPGAAGPADVVVATPGGSARAIRAYTYISNG